MDAEARSRWLSRLVEGLRDILSPPSWAVPRSMSVIEVRTTGEYPDTSVEIVFSLKARPQDQYGFNWRSVWRAAVGDEDEADPDGVVPMIAANFMEALDRGPLPVALSGTITWIN